MPKAQQKVLTKLGILGGLAIVVFSYPLLSLYSGYLGAWPTLYVVLFGAWAGFILLAYFMADHAKLLVRRGQSERDAA